MKKLYKICFPALCAITMMSCSVEAPFDAPRFEGYGELSKMAFDLEMAGDQNLITRAGEEDILDDFNILIQTTGTNPTTKVNERYGDLPDVITLEAGNYIVTATYGENPDAEFEVPFYQGNSSEFTVKKDEITTNIGKKKMAEAKSVAK